MRKQWVLLVAVCFMLAGPFVTDAFSADKTYKIRIGTPTAGKHQQNATMEEFKKRIEAASNGKVQVELYPSSQLGTSVQMIQGVQDGVIQAVLIPSSYFASFAPAAAVADLPFLFKGSDNLYEVLNNKDFSLNKYLYKKGFYAAGWLRNVDRYILSTDPIKTLDDLKGKKIWCLPSPTLQDELKAYGSAPTTLDPGDIAVALQNGTVDGVETDTIFMGVFKLHTSAKYLNLVPASAMTNAFIFSADWMDELPKDISTLVTTTVQDVIRDFEYQYVENLNGKLLGLMKSQGLEIVEPSQELLAEMKTAAGPLHEQFRSASKDNKKIYDEVVKMVGK